MDYLAEQENVRPNAEAVSFETNGADKRPDVVEFSVVIPCLNEADTIEICIVKAHDALRKSNVVGEVIVADNNSSDESREIAARCGARVIVVNEKGYGSALMGGIGAARGRYVIMGDADDSYDFSEIPKFVDKIREGFDLVQGCRLPAGGGRILPGAMPRLHRYWGNPMFSFLARRMFWSPINDIYCGMRAFSKRLYERLELRCTGMEFATEMIIKSSIYQAKIAEVPITLHPDGRKTHAPHLKTFRDGWRTLRFFLMYSPRWLFLYPGALLMLLGVIGFALVMPGLRVGGVNFDAHTLLFSGLLMLLGYQAVLFALFVRVFAINEGLLPANRRMKFLSKIFNLENGLVAGAVGLIVGFALLFLAFDEWRRGNFGNLNYPQSMRLVIPGVTLTALGFQTILSSFFISIMELRRKRF